MLTDCSYECLALVIKYIYSGNVFTSNIEQKQEVERLLTRLQIGQVRDEKLKKEPNHISVPFIKTEPEKGSSQYSYDEESTVENFYHFMTNNETDNDQKRQTPVEKDTNIKCDKCNFITKELTEMQSHSEVTHDQENIKCKECDFFASSQTE